LLPLSESAELKAQDVRPGLTAAEPRRRAVGDAVGGQLFVSGVIWTAHGYNVAYSDEIGHFEYCDVVIQGKCKSGGASDATQDGDDVGCFSALESLLVQVSGCLRTDTDFDGVGYQPTSWYPIPGGISYRYNDFRNTLSTNPCPA
jgi:hypothetical protein